MKFEAVHRGVKYSATFDLEEHKRILSECQYRCLEYYGGGLTLSQIATLNGTSVTSARMHCLYGMLKILKITRAKIRKVEDALRVPCVEPVPIPYRKRVKALTAAQINCGYRL